MAHDYKLDSNWDGWLEIVVGVDDIDQAAAPLKEASGWETLYRGSADDAQKRGWNLDPNIVLDEHVLHIPETYGGLIRFVSFAGVSSVKQVRPEDAAPWDAGGVWLFNTRAHVLEDQSAALSNAGYPTREGIRAFEFGFLSVKEVIHDGPNGMRISVLEQIAPAIDPPEPYRLMSRAFNANMICRDHKESRAFYVDKLGFKASIDTTWDKDNPGLRLIAPASIFDGMETLHVSNISPSGDNFGSIELMTYDGDFDKADYSSNAAPPATGNLSLRFFVPNLDTKLAQFALKGVNPLYTPRTFNLSPYGEIRSAIIESPEGVWLEFFEHVG